MVQLTERRAAQGGEKVARVGPVLIGAPRLVRNSSSAVRDNVVVYWASPKGELQLAPDTRITQAKLDQMPEYKGWKRCEAVGAREIQKIGVILSRQEFERKKAMKIQRHILENEEIRQLQVRCRLRIAQGYSRNDQAMNEKILRRAKRSEDMLYAAIVSEFDPTASTTGLFIEGKEQSTSPLAHVGEKPQGIA